MNLNISKELNMKRTTLSESIRLNRKNKKYIFKLESEVNFE